MTMTTMATTATEEDHPVESMDPAPHLPTLPVTDPLGHPPVDALSGKGVAVVAAVNNAPVPSPASDRLPVVEICPFTQQQWRPSRSLPDRDRSVTSMSYGSVSDCTGSSYPSPALLGLLQNQRVAQEMASRNSPIDNYKAGGWQRPSPRKGTPVTTPHSANHASVNSHKKTTMQHGVHKKQPILCMRKSPRQDTVDCSTLIQVQGQRMDKMPPKLSMFYMTPWEYYRINGPYTIPPQAGPARPAVSASTSVVYELDAQYPAMGNIHTDDSIYDTFDRSNTLPSIRFSNAPIRRKHKQQLLQARSTGSMSTPSSSGAPVYRLGVANSLDVLRHFGQPAVVESNVTMHLKNTMNQLRRAPNPQLALSGLSVGPTPAPLAASSKPIGLRGVGLPTQGEMMIRAGIEANNAKKTLMRPQEGMATGAPTPDNLCQLGQVHEQAEDSVLTPRIEVDESGTASRRRKRRSRRAARGRGASETNNSDNIPAQSSEPNSRFHQVPESPENQTRSRRVQIQSPEEPSVDSALEATRPGEEEWTVRSEADSPADMQSESASLNVDPILIPQTSESAQTPTDQGPAVPRHPSSGSSLPDQEAQGIPGQANDSGVGGVVSNQGHQEGMDQEGAQVGLDQEGAQPGAREATAGEEGITVKDPEVNGPDLEAKGPVPDGSEAKGLVPDGSETKSPVTNDSEISNPTIGRQEGPAVVQDVPKDLNNNNSESANGPSEVSDRQIGLHPQIHPPQPSVTLFH